MRTFGRGKTLLKAALLGAGGVAAVLSSGAGTAAAAPSAAMPIQHVVGHAGYSSPLNEQTFLVNTINAVMASPFWMNTAIIINWDDSDCWYDHRMGPIVNSSAMSLDALSGAGSAEPARR